MSVSTGEGFDGKGPTDLRHLMTRNEDRKAKPLFLHPEFGAIGPENPWAPFLGGCRILGVSLLVEGGARLGLGG